MTMKRNTQGRWSAYDSDRWRTERRLFLSERPLCLGCEAVGVVAPAEVVDHIVPHQGNEVIFWDRSRWQSCCKWHHDAVKQTLELRFAKGAIGAADLRLDSAIAVAATKRARLSVGVDGWPA
jgi:5-methylcytosine-specific restriction protein A